MAAIPSANAHRLAGRASGRADSSSYELEHAPVPAPALPPAATVGTPTPNQSPEVNVGSLERELRKGLSKLKERETEQTAREASLRDRVVQLDQREAELATKEVEAENSALSERLMQQPQVDRIGEDAKSFLVKEARGLIDLLSEHMLVRQLGESRLRQLNTLSVRTPLRCRATTTTPSPASLGGIRASVFSCFV
jgi:hypothetical protein